MKIICVGRNYAKHAAELKNELPEHPILFLKPDTALLHTNEAFYIPTFSQEIHYECELVVRIGKDGKNIDPKFAERYIDAIALGIDFTARDLQNQLKSKGLPWEISKAFNGSAFVSPWVNKDQLPAFKDLNFRFELNGITKQIGKASEMIFNYSTIVAYASKFFTLRKGDMVFTGTPEGVGPVHSQDILVGYLQNQKVFSLPIK